jgi:hypothetical protein
MGGNVLTFCSRNKGIKNGPPSFAGCGKGLKMTGKNCEFQGKIYPDGSGVCIGDQCIQCHDGSWGPNEFESELKKRNLAIEFELELRERHLEGML